MTGEHKILIVKRMKSFQNLAYYAKYDIFWKRKTIESYTLLLWNKLEEIEYAKSVENRATAQMFGVSHTQIIRWRSKEELKNTNIRSRRVGSGSRLSYPLAENALKKWIIDLRNRELEVTPSKMIENCSRTILVNAAHEFKASDSRFNLLLKRQRVSLRRRTKTGQNYPKLYRQKLQTSITLLKLFVQKITLTLVVLSTSTFST